jgi:hypothetical protein
MIALARLALAVALIVASGWLVRLARLALPVSACHKSGGSA